MYVYVALCCVENPAPPLSVWVVTSGAVQLSEEP